MNDFTSPPVAHTSRPRILLAVHTYANSYLHLPPHFVDGGFEVDLLARPGNPLLALRSVRRRWRAPSDDAGFATRTRELLATGDYTAMQLVDEPALLALFGSPDSALPKPYLPFTDPELMIGVGRKREFQLWCERHGLPTPRTAHATNWNALAPLIAAFGPSCFLKGSTGSGGKTVRLIKTPADLDDALLSLGRHGPWLVQQHIDGPTGGVQFAAYQGRLLGWFAIYKRVMLGDGRGPTLVGEFCAPAGIEEICARACAAGGLNGLHGFDFMLGPDGSPLLIDPHLGRCTTLKHFGPRCGVNLAALWQQALLGRELPVARPTQTGGVFAKFPELIQHFCDRGPRRALSDLRPWGRLLHIGWGTPREFPAICMASIQLLANGARISAGALRHRLRQAIATPCW